MADMTTLPYPPIPSKAWCDKHGKMFRMVDYELPTDLFIERWIVPAGTTIKIWQTQNFGWVKLQADQTDKRGFTIPKTLFNW